jgi:hypothetical protein
MCGIQKERVYNIIRNSSGLISFIVESKALALGLQ